jgi:hypothetical protein
MMTVRQQQQQLQQLPAFLSFSMLPPAYTFARLASLFVRPPFFSFIFVHLLRHRWSSFRIDNNAFNLSHCSYFHQHNRWRRCFKFARNCPSSRSYALQPRCTHTVSCADPSAPPRQQHQCG